MAGVPVVTNRLSLPPGYSKYASTYTPWNGFVKGLNSPAAKLIGAIQDLSVASVPADLSSFTLSGPNFQQYIFQFVYAGSVPSAGITIALPNGALSTAAEVTDALVAIMSLSAAFTFDNVLTQFPWNIDRQTATLFRIEWNVAGNITSVAFPDGITIDTESQPVFAVGSAVPGTVGKLGALLPTA